MNGGNFSLKDLESLQARDFTQSRLLSREEEMQCIEQIKCGDQVARDRLILSTLRLVLSISGKFRGKGVSQADIRQAGTIGLLSAVDGYIADMGYKFSSYAGVCIANEIRQSFREWIAIPLPRNLARMLKDVKEALRTLLARDGYSGLSPVRIAEELILTQRYQDQAIEDLILAVDDLLPFTFPIVSLDGSIEVDDGDSSITLLDILSSDEEDVDLKISDKDFNEILIGTLMDLGIQNETKQEMFFKGKGDPFGRRDFFCDLQRRGGDVAPQTYSHQSGCPFSRRFRWMVLDKTLFLSLP